MKRHLLACAVLVAAALSPVAARADTASDCGPWMDPSLSPDRRADLVLAQMTLDDKVAMTHAISDSEHAR